MKSLSEIRSLLRAHAAELERRYGIANLSLFGSVVRGGATDRSDIDILADIPLSVNLFGLMDAELYLSDILGASVDLVSRDEIRPELRERILKEAVAV